MTLDTARAKDDAGISAPKMVEELVRKAERAGASDIHLQMTAGAAEVYFRLDGIMVPAATLAHEAAERVMGRLKFLARLKTYQESMPQDGRIDRRALDSANDIRVATYPTVTGEKIVLRLFRTETAKGLDELEFPEEGRRALEKFLRRTMGMMLLTGPAGSGKTTTIYACLRALVELGGRHVITIEDPAEQIIAGVMQTEINEARGLDFAKAARHLLRQDPQALVIGEIRDEETANIAVRAALTGHLVISTLHAGSCRGVLERLLVLCPDCSAIAAALELVVNQRLMRRVCGDCRGAGCEMCLGTGYRGRAPVAEWLAVDEAARGKIREGDLTGIRPVRSLEESGRALVERSVSNELESRRVFGL